MKTRKKLVTNGEPDRLDEIYRTAAEIIFEKGFDATSMSDIADAVGMTKAGVYHYIPGKKDLLFALMSYALDHLDQDVIIPARKIPDAETRLRFIIQSHVKLITGDNGDKGNGLISILTDELPGLTKIHRRKIIERKREYLDLVRATMDELKAEGKLKDLDTTVCAFTIFGTVMWLARWYRPGGRLKGEDIADEITRIAIGGMFK
ncbi:MAG TPA: TetR/AcrR family transcriptional regulator [Blastocatellia bacterium]|nr:TetR/AcrR family transcriptional regulator [Blastocatellia bacterium]